VVLQISQAKGPGAHGPCPDAPRLPVECAPKGVGTAEDFKGWATRGVEARKASFFSGVVPSARY
jgi:hypothetical protein